MNINLTPEQERIVNDELRSGHFRSAEEVIAKALVVLRESERSSLAKDGNGHHESAVREMLNFVEANRTPSSSANPVTSMAKGNRLPRRLRSATQEIAVIRPSGPSHLPASRTVS